MKSRPKIIIGVDEVGRGPLAGPVMACALSVASITMACPKNTGLKDSKRLSPKKREQVYQILKAESGIEWGLGRVSEKVIDRINIFEATKLAMKRAVNNLKSKIQMTNQIQNPKAKGLFLLLDGNFKIGLDIPQKSIIKGDEKVFLIKLASIVAKVHRDRGMLRYHKRFPEYGFACHKGYGTKLHLKMLAKYGPCQIHRKSFKPIIKYQILKKTTLQNSNLFGNIK